MWGFKKALENQPGPWGAYNLMETWTEYLKRLQHKYNKKYMQWEMGL